MLPSGGKAHAETFHKGDTTPCPLGRMLFTWGILP
jgi:hypothetical protein